MAKLVVLLTQKIEYLASITKLVYWIAARYYRNVIQREICLAGITANDHILFIGGGLCPFSAILLHQNTGAKVTVIDNNPGCIQNALDNVNRLGISEYVRVLHEEGDSENLLLSEYSVIHFAMQVFPMFHVFTQVERQAAPGTKILVRKPKRHLNIFYSKLSALTCCKHVVHNGASNIGSTILYVKQGQPL